MIEDDKLLIAIKDKTFAVNADAVVAVVEAERLFMLPIIHPVISLPANKLPAADRGEPPMERASTVVQSSLSYLKSGFIKGTITWRGDVIVVIDIGELFGMPSVPDKGPYRVAIIKKDASSLGILAPDAAEANAAERGEKGISFIWKEELDKLEFEPSNENYTLGWIDPAGKKIRLVDWQKILEETQKTVSGKS